MLTNLSIQNVVLIEKLSLACHDGLAALTGETGAGKSILLDALGLTLGQRADSGMVRHTAEQAMVSAAFDLPAGHPVQGLLQEQGFDAEDQLILKRIVSKDGRSKAFVNDQPASVGLLKQIGAQLVEIHGQFETQGLLDTATHRQTLDDYAGNHDLLSQTRTAWKDWQNAQKAYHAALEDVEAARQQEDWLTHVVDELEKLNPEKGEEDALSQKRQLLMNSEKLITALQQATDILDSDEGVTSQLSQAEGILSRLSASTPEKMDSILNALGTANAEISEALSQMASLASDLSGEGESPDAVEERYFALKDCARKHGCTPDDLPDLYVALKRKLQLVTQQEDTLQDLQKQVDQKRKAFITVAEKLSAARQTAAKRLGKAVMKELPPLRLEKAEFSVAVTDMEDSDWGMDGKDKIRFMIAPNPGAPAEPLNKIASGGELARLMLALKVVLAETSHIPVLIFDEADSGVGGATANAVGERLARLSTQCQVLAITHSPQVAARAHHHWVVSKSDKKGKITTDVTVLDSLSERQEEIARMLAGADITKEARAAAGKLLEHHDVAA